MKNFGNSFSEKKNFFERVFSYKDPTKLKGSRESEYLGMEFIQGIMNYMGDRWRLKLKFKDIFRNKFAWYVCCRVFTSSKKARLIKKKKLLY